jgi:hypothetical protein
MDGPLRRGDGRTTNEETVQYLFGAKGRSFGFGFQILEGCDLEIPQAVVCDLSIEAFAIQCLDADIFRVTDRPSWRENELCTANGHAHTLPQIAIERLHSIETL